MEFLKRNYGWIIVAVLGSLPLLVILNLLHIDFANGITLAENTGSEGKTTIGMLYHVSGEFAIRWMTAVLSCTPFFILFGVNNLFVRQAMGIATGVWSFIHFIIFLCIEGFFETFTQINYIAGFVGVVILIPLFFTSNRKSMKKLKTNWKKLQQYAYLAIFLSLLHIAILDKTWLIYAVIVGLGFFIRLPFIKNRLIGFRKGSTTF